MNIFHPVQGQARKSLWIETTVSNWCTGQKLGQARKSLWIETLIHKFISATLARVRLCLLYTSPSPRDS